MITQGLILNPQSSIRLGSCAWNSCLALSPPLHQFALAMTYCPRSESLSFFLLYTVHSVIACPNPRFYFNLYHSLNFQHPMPPVRMASECLSFLKSKLLYYKQVQESVYFTMSSRTAVSEHLLIILYAI